MKKDYQMPEMEMHEVNASAFCEFVSVTDEQGDPDVKVDEFDACMWTYSYD